MNPALSVIFFTTLSGAGYGLLAWIGILIALDPPIMLRNSDDGFTQVFFGLLYLWLTAGAALTAIGLASSMFHLGKPLRAWRAFSQWRTSWLSREGVMAMATYAPVVALVFLLQAERHAGATALSPTSWLVPWVAGAMAVLSLLTVACTAMIYASLKPVPAWRDRLVTPGYLVLGLHTGGLLLVALFSLSGMHSGISLQALLILATTSLASAWIKEGYWHAIDRIELPSRESATALEGIGKVTTFERPHTEANYLTREMGFVLARKHSRKLRKVALGLFAVAPLVALFVSALLPAAGSFALPMAALSALLGTFVERWLFFAEAKHMVALYY